MNKIIIKTTIGFLSLGLITGADILTTNYTKQDSQLAYTAKSAQRSSSLNSAEQEIEQLEELNANEVKENAEKELKNAEEVINKISKEKEEAIVELNNAKTTKEKKAAQAKIDAATEKIKQAEVTKKSAEKKVEEAIKIVEKQEQNKQIVEEKGAEVNETINNVVSDKNSEYNSTVTDNKTQSTTKNNTPANNNTPATQKEELEEQGPKFDLSEYQDLLDKINKKTEEQVKEIEEEAKKKTVEFHFYSSNKELILRCRGDHCGEDQQGYIWFVELECDLNKCEGFTDSTTGAKVSKLLLGRRGDVTYYTVTAPAAKYGYKFVGWELVSTRKTATNDLGTGALLGKYIATYEKV